MSTAPQNGIGLQRPVGSPFGRHSTTSDVLAGVDLTRTRALVTGGYVGLGLETTRALCAAGAHVVVPARREDVAREALGDLPDAEVGTMDLADLESVRAFAEEVLAAAHPIDLLITNAGVMASPERRVGSGWESQFAINHLGHFALVNRLLPLLPNDARVVALSSRGHHLSDIRWDDMMFDGGYDKWLAYGQAKTANVLFARHLDGDRIRAFAVHPGEILTELVRDVSREERMEMGWIDADGTVIDDSFKTAAEGAATTVWGATSVLLGDHGGVYLQDCEVAEVVDAPPGEIGETGVRPYAVDPDAASRLWALSAELTGVDGLR